MTLLTYAGGAPPRLALKAYMKTLKGTLIAKGSQCKSGIIGMVDTILGARTISLDALFNTLQPPFTVRLVVPPTFHCCSPDVRLNKCLDSRVTSTGSDCLPHFSQVVEKLHTSSQNCGHLGFHKKCTSKSAPSDLMVFTAVSAISPRVNVIASRP